MIKEENFNGANKQPEPNILQQQIIKDCLESLLAGKTVDEETRQIVLKLFPKEMGREEAKQTILAHDSGYVRNMQDVFQARLVLGE